MQRVPPDVAVPEAPRPRLVVAAGVLVGLTIFLTLLSLHRLPPSEQGLTDKALDVVSDLERALDGNDVGTLMGLLAPEWVVLDLPGSTSQILPQSTPFDPLRLYVETVDLDLTACEAERATEPLTRLVRCNATVDGDLPAVLGRGESEAIVVGVNDDHIVSVFRESGRGEMGGPLHYCMWAEAEQPELTAGAFDISCVPIGDGSVHNRLAAMYVDAGRPAPTAEDLQSRLSVGIVAAVDSFQHDPGTLARTFSNDWPLVRYPGLLPAELRSPFPSISEFLTWSDLVYEVDLGDCGIAARLRNGGYRVECGEARWAGPLLTNLGLESIKQPIGFFVEEGLISGVVGTTSDALDGAVAGLCRWAHDNEVTGAATAFRADCAPRYTPQAAAAILVLAEDYTGHG